MSRFIDYKAPFLGAMVVAFLSFKYAYTLGPLKELQEFIKSFVEFGSLCFGVLLTFFGIVIQSSSETIRQMKSRAKNFNRFIVYNRNMIIFSLVLTVCAYILGNLNFWKITTYSISELVISIFFGALVYFLYGLLYLLLIFFNLLRQHENYFHRCLFVSSYDTWYREQMFGRIFGSFQSRSENERNDDMQVVG